jgi:hypothetical protein
LTRSPRDSTALEALAKLGFDPKAILAREPGVLLDPRFLGALRRQLTQEFGAREASLTLLQIGFLHGLRDALDAVAATFAGPQEGARAPAAPALAIRFRALPACAPSAAIEVCGLWPERAEAGVRGAGAGAEAALAAGCHVSAGYTSGWLSGLFEADLLALETGCSAAGDPACEFVAREADAWRAGGDPRAARLLAALPFGAFRELLRRQEAKRPPEPGPEGFDPEAAVIHIWGPVMVLPFSGADEALRAVELIGREPGAREVSVVVVDLSGAVLDEAFGAAALEQILESVEAWGAEAVLAGVGPLSQRVVADLARQPLLVHKDLQPAIAAGFQIARAQRRSV